MTTARLLAIAWLGLLVFLAVFEPARAAEPEPTLSGAALVRALREGGYNIYFRHAATDWSQSDDVRQAGDWTSCDPSRIRQLSAEGRDTARAVGAAIRSLGIPVGRVLASPYCRTVETARLMALGPVETTTDVMNLRVADYFGGREAIAARARARLSIAPASGSNTVLVAHGNVARLATRVYPGEGEGAVFQPLEGGGFVHVASVPAEEWSRLAKALSGE